MAVKKLIEVALPLEKINEESAREKHIMQGHPQTLHIWWARRPLATARAVIWASLVDDPSSHPELFPNDEEQAKERKRLFGILENLVKWENSNNEDILDAAKNEIRKYNKDKELALLDPFAGGGTIPLEAQRLGIKPMANDLNPVAVTINKSMIEIPARFSNIRPVNPESRNVINDNITWNRAKGLSMDISYYGNVVKTSVLNDISRLYPKVRVPKELGGGETNAIAWLWAKTVKCPNPACGCNTPLLKSFNISTKKGNECAIVPHLKGKDYVFTLTDKALDQDFETVNRTGAICLNCKSTIPIEYIREQGKQNDIGNVMTCIVAEGKKGRFFVTPDENQIVSSNCPKPEDYPDGKLSNAVRYISPPIYGMENFSQLYTNRQLQMLNSLCKSIADISKKIEEDAKNAGMEDDHLSIREGGTGAKAYSEAVRIYLSFVVDKMINFHSTICSWQVPRQTMGNVFSRQAIPMKWDYAEANPFSNSTGSFDSMLSWIVKCVENLPSECEGTANQADAQTDHGYRNMMISTDPPYYDNIGYSDLSDYFYIWMRKNLGDIYPDLFSTILVPKNEELIASQYRHKTKEDAKRFFEDEMLKACKKLYLYADKDIPVSIYYAYKQQDKGKGSESSSSGWETMLSAIINAGFEITGTWPMRTEVVTALKGSINALASSIVLVCRKRNEDAPQITQRNMINVLRRELRPALKKLQSSNIAPVDLAQSAIGPGMGVYSRYSKVIEADGTQMPVKSALKLINEEIDLYFNEQVGEMDPASRFCVELYSQNAFNDVRYGEAEVLANAKNTSIPMLVNKKVLFAKAGNVHLLSRDELSTKVNNNEEVIWILTQHLTLAMEKGGIDACAKMVLEMYGANAERAKDLAYRLYTIAEQKNWSNEAYAYNSLVVAWPDIQSRAAALKAVEPKQMSLFDLNYEE